jgi:hypothetical protein
MLAQTLNFKVSGTLSCMAVANADGINITQGDMDGDLDIGGNDLERLPFLLGEVTGDFKMDNNRITQLAGAPHWVGGSFYCRTNQLQTLAGCPKLVGANFCCDGNQLTSLMHLPENIPGMLSCADNQIASLGNISLQVGDTLNLSNNPLISLRSIHERLTSCERLVVNGCPIQEGGVSLIKVSTLCEVVAFNTGDFERAAYIINKYLNLRDSGANLTALMLKCKAELEREGLAPFGLL